jgi:hypothetical protein
MSAITFKAKLYKIGSWTILHLPNEASAKLPSRGMTLVAAMINDTPFTIVLEPDGRGSHWFKFDKNMSDTTGAKVGETVTITMEPSKAWPEPDVPEDIQTALGHDPKAHAIWNDVTPMARWDWIRWIRSTNVPATRAHRIDVARDKLKKGIRRPCCFNRNVCTEPYVAHNWMLKEPN